MIVGSLALLAVVVAVWKWDAVRETFDRWGL